MMHWSMHASFRTPFFPSFLDPWWPAFHFFVACMHAFSFVNKIESFVLSHIHAKTYSLLHFQFFTSQLLVTRLHLCMYPSIKFLQQHGWRWNQRPCMEWWQSSTAAANQAGAVFDALRQLWPALVVLATAEDIRVMDIVVVVTPIENVVLPAPPAFFSFLT